MKNLLAWIGAVALLGWTGAGAAAWLMAKDGVTLVVSETTNDAREVEADPVSLLADRVEGVATDVSALAAALERTLGVLDERAEERSAELARTVAQLRTDLDARRDGDDAADLAAQVRALREQVAALGAADANAEASPALVEPEYDVAPGPEAAERDAVAVAAAVAPPAVLAPAGPAPQRSSFLAFTLPSDDFRFDERRHWTIDPKLSRVGFDGKSTLHDFTGTSQAVRGSLAFVLAHPADGPVGEVRVDARSLRSGSAGRDEGMLENLDVAHHGEIEFALSSFEATRVDTTAAEVEGTARGTMTIRGVAREFAMPVTASVDASRRLALTGEAVLHLPDWDVPVPNKLGLITMEEDVRVWIAVKAKLDARVERSSAQ